MGLTCSLLGHAFEETDVEREREEQGSEVVTVVRETEVCSRCGETRVVSENKEVTSIVEPETVGVDDEPGGDAFSSAAAAEEGSNPSTRLGPDPDLEEDAEDDSLDEEFEPPGDPAEEDAEILEDNREPERTPGQWPDDETGFEPNSLTHGTPEEEVGRNVVEDATDGDDDDVDEPSDPQPEPAAGTATVARGEYVCPECGFSTRAGNSSLREGDACPECQRDYLDAR